MKDVIGIYIGFDSREAVAADVCAHSIRRRTKSTTSISYLQHRPLRKSGMFSRPWLIDAQTGEFMDLIDSKPFTTEFSHTRFLVPALMEYKGWALFMDCDMIFQSDIQRLFDLCDDNFAVMCVKHTHVVDGNTTKMDDRQQLRYHRKNWSSFVLWNCRHPANKVLTADRVNCMKGTDLHAFSWLPDNLIGSIPFSYNYIHGVSPALSAKIGYRPDVIHYTEGGPWFDTCKDVPYAGNWIDEYEDYQKKSAGYVSHVPSASFEERAER